MRLDLHNHTIPANPVRTLSKFDNLSWRVCREGYLEIIRSHQLDGLAITNCHNVEVALRFAAEYPWHIIVGAEYQVLIGQGTTAQIVVLEIDDKLHQQLMSARLRGIAHFASVVKRHALPYFLAHLGWGIPSEHPNAPQLLESMLQYVDAIEVANIHGMEKMRFASGLARYYGLAPIGGSDHLISVTQRRAFTIAPQATNRKEFFAAMHTGDVQVQVSGISAKRRTEDPLIGGIRQNIYFQKLQRLWQSEFSWHPASGKKMREAIIFPFLQKLPYSYYLKQQKSYTDKVATLETRFLDYLQLKITQEIFSSDKSLAEKQSLWEQAMSKIYRCFFASIPIEA